MLLESALDLSNYIHVNVNAIQVYGLKCAAYLAEVARVYNKAVIKKRASNGFMTLDRVYIRQRTGIPEEEQYSLDAALSSAGIFAWSPSDPDMIKFDFMSYLNSISSDDAKMLDSISRKVARASKGSEPKAVRERKAIDSLKSSVSTGNAAVDAAIREWIEEVRPLDSRMTAATVRDFERTVMGFAKGDVSAAVRIVEIATSQKWLNPLSAIDAYQRERSIKAKSPSALRVADSVSDIKF